MAGGKPVHIMQNVADDLLDGAAEPHDLTSMVTPATGPAASPTTCYVQVELGLGGARSRSSHRLVG